MNKRGMTLLEIVISLGILVIIVTSLTKVFTSGVSLTMEIFSPARALNSVDFPTFGRPTMATIGLLIIY